jgi:hypothetical protein
MSKIYPRWFAFLFGGNFKQNNGGFGWRPSLFRMVLRYYKEGWSESKSLWDFVRMLA